MSGGMAREAMSATGQERGAQMAERWFSEDELSEMSRPTMDRAIEAIEAGDLWRAKARWEGMKHEGRFLHDMMVDGIAASMTWVKENCGEEAVGESQRWAMERYWKRRVKAIDARGRKGGRSGRRGVGGAAGGGGRELAELLAATWRAHSCSGTGPQPGAFTM